MSTTTIALMGHLAQLRVPFIDNLKAGPAASQATALPALSMASRYTTSPGNTGSVILKDMLTQEAPNIYWIINDTAFTMNVYPFGTQTINGAGAALTIASGGFAFLSRIRASLDWRGAIFT